METPPSILADRMRGIEKTLIRRIHDLAGPKGRRLTCRKNASYPSTRSAV